MGKILGLITGFILALIAVPLLVSAAAGVSAQSALLNADTFKEAFANQNVYTDLVPIILPAIIEQTQLDNEQGNIILNVMENLTIDQRRSLAAILTPPEWVQEQSENIIDIFFGILSGNLDSLQKPVDLSALSERLAGEEAVQAAEFIIGSAPECSPQQTTAIETFQESGQGGIPLCLPESEELRGVSTAYIVDQMGQSADFLEQRQFTAADFFFQERDARVLNLAYEMTGQFILLLYLCPGALLALIVTLIVRSARSFGRWMGVIFVITGALTLLILLGLQVIVVESFSGVTAATTEAQRLQAEFGAGLLRSITAQMGTPLLIQAGLFIAIGFVMFVIAMVAPHAQNAPTGFVLVTEDGRVISTATGRRTVSIPAADLPPQNKD